MINRRQQKDINFLGQINFGNSGSKFDRAWDNSVWDDEAKDYLMLANIDTENGEIHWWIDEPNEEQKMAVEEYASQFVDDGLMMLEIEAEAVIILQMQSKPKTKANTKSKSKSIKKIEIYEKAIAELKYDKESTFCQIIEKVSKEDLSEKEKQDYIHFLLNDIENKITFKTGNKILKNEFEAQAVFPPLLKVVEPKDLSFRGKVVSISKYSASKKDDIRPAMDYVFHDENSLVATDAHQLVVINVKDNRNETFYDKSGAITFPREIYPKYKSVIPERIENNNILDLKQLIEQIKGVDKVNGYFSKKTNELPALKLLFKENGNMLFTNPKITLKALMSLWMTGVTKVDISVYPNNNIVFYDVDNDKTLAIVMAIAHDDNTFFTPILGNGIN